MLFTLSFLCPEYKITHTFLLSIVVSINITFLVCRSYPFGARDTPSGHTIPLRGTRCRGGHHLSLIFLYDNHISSFTAYAAGARPFLIRGKGAKAYQGEEPAVPLLGTSPPEIVCAKKNEVLSLCCVPVGLWIASAFALQKLIRKICMIPSFTFSL